MKRYWPTLLVVAVIIYATWIPRPIPYESLPGVPGIDKLIHAVMFGGLTGAMLFDRRRGTSVAKRLDFRMIAVACCIAGGFAVVDEVVQGLLDIGRPSDPMDILADWVGIAIAAFTAPPVINKIFKK